MHLPLLILDEAHHVKNPNRLARLFDNEEAEQDAEALQGPLGNMFEKMLFLTATPFQLGHHELLNVLDRFHGVRWPSALARTRFDQQTEHLRSALDRAQATALRLERAWARIDPLDGPLVAELGSFEPHDDQPEALRTALTIATEARADIATAEELLRPWVIRHVKPHKAQRRRYRPGRSILDDSDSDLGLPVEGPATLPFLLAARAQAVASLQGADGERSTRAYFAYGLASSFEAYADTRRNRVARLDESRRRAESPPSSPRSCAGTSTGSPRLSRTRRSRAGHPIRRSPPPSAGCVTCGATARSRSCSASMSRRGVPCAPTSRGRCARRSSPERPPGSAWIPRPRTRCSRLSTASANGSFAATLAATTPSANRSVRWPPISTTPPRTRWPRS